MTQTELKDNHEKGCLTRWGDECAKAEQEGRSQIDGSAAVLISNRKDLNSSAASYKRGTLLTL